MQVIKATAINYRQRSGLQIASHNQIIKENRLTALRGFELQTFHRTVFRGIGIVSNPIWHWRFLHQQVQIHNVKLPKKKTSENPYQDSNLLEAISGRKINLFGFQRPPPKKKTHNQIHLKYVKHNKHLMDLSEDYPQVSFFRPTYSRNNQWGSFHQNCCYHLYLMQIMI